MRLTEITTSITTRYLEQEKSEFIHMVTSIISNKISLTDNEFNNLLNISSTMISKYKIDDSGFNEIMGAFSKLVSYHRNKRGI